MKTKKYLSFGVLLLLAYIASASLKPELEARYAQWDAAYRKHDVKALERMLASDFRIVTGSGKIIVRTDYVKSFAKTKAPKVYRTRVLRVASEKGRALAWTEEISQKAGEKAHIHRYRDTWVRLGRTWLLRESTTLEE